MTARRIYEPKRDRLYELAVGQQGFFTTRQASEVGVTTPYLDHYLDSGHVVRVGRGVYRLVRFPAGDQDDLIQVWLATAREGVFSHETALALHQLSDILPARIHMILPPAWRRRKYPGDIERHYTDLAPSEVWWIGAVPATAPLRTVEDCIAAHVSPELVRQALHQAQARGILRDTEVSGLRERHGSTHF